MVTIIPMLIAEIRDRGAALLEEYAAECSIPALGETEPQWGMYELLQASGQLHAFGAWHDGLLVGFGTVLISKLPHYGVRVGIVESLFVGSEWRHTGAGTAVMREITECGCANGCSWTVYQARVGSQLERILDGKHAVPIASIYLEPISQHARDAGEG